MMHPKKRLIVAIAVVTVLMTITVGAALREPTKVIPQPEVVAKQLSKVGGVIPLEIRDAKASFPKSNEMQDFSCLVKNNSGKEITTIVLAYKITTVNPNNEEITDTFVLLRESFVHEDVREAHHFRPLVPEQAYLFESAGVTAFDNASIKRVEASIDYVEFEDKTKLGPDLRGSQIISQLREGAASYKKWLTEKYRQLGFSVDSIVTLLKEQDLPKEIGLSGRDEEHGARVYRNHMLAVFQTHGAHELEKFLNR